MRTNLRALAVVIVTALALIAPSTAPSTASSIAHAQPTGRDILLMGSSTTGCTGPSTPSACFVNKVKAARAADRFTVLARGGTYVAYGTPSQNWTTTAIPGGHDIVVVQLGINDWYVPVTPLTFGAQVAELLQRVRSANPDAEIHWVRTWMPAPTGNADIRRSMWVRHGFSTADAVETVGGTFHDMSGTPTRFAVDSTGWHYNNLGHQRLADLLLSFM